MPSPQTSVEAPGQADELPGIGLQSTCRPAPEPPAELPLVALRPPTPLPALAVSWPLRAELSEALLQALSAARSAMHSKHQRSRRAMAGPKHTVKWSRSNSSSVVRRNFRMNDAQGSNGMYLLSAGENRIRIWRGSRVNLGASVYTSSSLIMPLVEGW